ncbi:phage baseplate assembly protein V [Paenibacillus dendritiformis]|uniref:phage baseplate assembly protein V n=1 Tax=Paenibacillus dendritiformis TaxID=130049 RepID=UPI00248B9380|nr:phage baseplate assembly protein V [Paenibacillus dendritiformis]WGU93557.1 phage baseplate assembly protein V [Paenibacillus dendritiformis]
MGDKVITFGNIYVAPFEFINLQSLKVVKKMNDHVRLTITGMIPEERKESYVNLADSHTYMRVSLADESGKPKYWFQGIVIRANVTSVRGIYYLAVDAISHTYLMDIKPKKRSFQNPQMSFAGLIRSVLSGYSKADFIDSSTQSRKLGTFFMQYEETDWQFLKRMASQFYTGLVPAAAYTHPKFYFGLPQDQNKGKLEASHYTVQKRAGEYQRALVNRLPGVTDQDFVVYEVESSRVLEIGNEVIFQSRSLVVGEAVTELKNGVLTYTYKLFPRRGLQFKKIYNHKIIGASIQGRVIEVKKDTVRAKLDMDDQQDQSTAHWFPYSTIYASDNNTGWYVMPEVNDQIRIYFPSKKEADGIAISSVLKESPETKLPPKTSNSSPGEGLSDEGSEQSDPMADPSTKWFRTKYGKEISLAKDKIVISSKDMSITISDEHGIDIVSSKNINITAAKDILMSSQNIRIQAGKVELSGKGNTITLENTVEMKGEEVKMN